MAHALSMGASMDSAGGSGGDKQQGAPGSMSMPKKPRKEVEMFVLDGRYAYGSLPQPSRPASAELERPCSDCPLIAREGSALQAPAAAAAAANGAAGQMASNGSVPAAAAAAAAAAAEAVASAAGSSGGVGGGPGSL
jgi:hypothetical protein